MKELRKKTYLTLWTILSLILLSVLVLMNLQGYLREREDIRRMLNILEDRNAFRENGHWPGNGIPGDPLRPGEDADPVPENAEAPRLKPRELENMMIPEKEMYTVAVKDGRIDGIFNFGNVSENFDVTAVAEEILAKEDADRMYAENLYFAGYSFRYHYGESIVILNTADIRSKLRTLLAESMLLLVVMEAVIIFVTGRITRWITKPAEEAFTRQREFIADASHELKTPLAVIMASADEMHPVNGEASYLENIRYESDRMSRLIAGLLNLSKLENTVEVSERKEEDLSRILEKTCLSYEGVAFEQQVAIETKIEENLKLLCNREEMEQMFSTILDNAVHHSRPGSAVCVEAERSRKKRNGICIRMINTGDAIPEGEEEKIFERFYRGDKARSRKDNRYGLGLAIARRIARNHSGDIRAHSENGRTVFTIELPQKA